MKITRGRHNRARVKFQMNYARAAARGDHADANYWKMRLLRGARNDYAAYPS